VDEELDADVESITARLTADILGVSERRVRQLKLSQTPYRG